MDNPLCWATVKSRCRHPPGRIINSRRTRVLPILSWLRDHVEPDWPDTLVAWQWTGARPTCRERAAGASGDGAQDRTDRRVSRGWPRCRRCCSPWRASSRSAACSATVRTKPLPARPRPQRRLLDAVCVPRKPAGHRLDPTIEVRLRPSPRSVKAWKIAGGPSTVT